VQPKTLKPVWSESFEFEGSCDDLLKCQLRLEVHDYDLIRVGQEKLGECTAPVAELKRDRPDSASLDIEAELQIATVTSGSREERESYASAIKLHHARLWARELAYGLFLAMVSFFDGSGYWGLVESKTVAGRLIAVAWEICCMLLIASSKTRRTSPKFSLRRTLRRRASRRKASARCSPRCGRCAFAKGRR